MRRSLITLAALTVLGLALAPGASARGTFVCDTGPEGNPIAFRTFDQNVVVPNGATCQLVGVVVYGNITVGDDAGLNIDNPAGGAPLTVAGNVSVGSRSAAGLRGRIEGNVSAGSASTVSLDSTNVVGNYSGRNASLIIQNSPIVTNLTLTGGSYTAYGVGTVRKNATCTGGAVRLRENNGGHLYVLGHDNGCSAG